MRKLNILYHHRTQGRGAEGTHIVSIIRGFEKLGHSVTLISPPGIDPLKEIGAPPVDKTKVKTRGIQRLWKLISKHVPNPVFELIEIAYNIPATRRLEKCIQENQFDFIFERYAFYLIAGSYISKKYSIPLIVEANEVSGIKERARKQNFQRLCDMFESRLFQQSKAIFTVSSFLKKMIENKNIDEAKIHVLPNAIDLEIVKVTKDLKVLKESLGLQGRTVIGFGGWFDHWDRLDFLLEVFADLVGDNDSLAILLIGDGPAVASLKEFTRAHSLEDRVVFTGAVPKKDMFSYLSLLDIAILPHSNEFGSPVILFEMMALRKPIVAPKLAPIEDVLTDRENALLFEPLDKASCKEALREMINSEEKRKEFSDKSFELLVRQHTWVNNSKTIIETAVQDALIN